MKKTSILILLLLVVALSLSACKVKTPAAPTEAATAETVETEVSVATPDLLLPTADTRLTSDDGKMVCSIYPGFFPEMTAEQLEAMSVFPEISAEDWVRGPEDAILTIVEYSDFQCPACEAFYTELEKLIEKYPDDVRLVFRNLPLLSLHPNAGLAAQAAEAAGVQGKFWEMYDVLYSQRDDGFSLEAAAFTDWLIEKATEIGLDVAQFTADLTSEALVTKVQEGTDYALGIGVNATPTVLLNGRYWSYDWSAATLGSVIDVLKYEKNLYTECPPWVIDTDKQYTARIETEKGELVLNLFAKEAPLAVNSFVFLAEEGFYNGVSFHRVMHDFVAQTGDPSGTGISGSGYQFRNEVDNNLTFDEAGMLGMANAGADTNGSQFFITYVPTPDLNGNYTIFGMLADAKSMDILLALNERDPSTTPDLAPGDKIINITIEAK